MGKQYFETITQVLEVPFAYWFLVSSVNIIQKICIINFQIRIHLVLKLIQIPEHEVLS